MIVVFLHQLNGTEIQFFVLYLKKGVQNKTKNEIYTPPKIRFFLLFMNKINGHEI